MTKLRLADKATNPRAGIPIDKSKIESLIPKYNGNVSRIADKLGTTRHTIKRICDKDEHLTQLLHDARERFVDDLEDCAQQKAIGGDTIMQIFMLKTLGKHRGYSQDQTHDLSADLAKQAFEFVVNRSKNPALSNDTQSNLIDHVSNASNTTLPTLPTLPTLA